jgi:pimeloyl-ACP methyl ester carboxylesterase
MTSVAIPKTGIRFVPTEPLISNRRLWTTRLMSGLYALLAAAAFFTVGYVAHAAESVGRYADVNGLHMYYEVHGEGTPILLIHGGLCTVDACFGDLIERLASTRKVIAYEYQGHGHTADIDRPLRFDLLADDASKFLKVLNIQRADVLGFSDGAGVAFQLARTHPEQVKSLITISLFTTRDGAYPELFAGMKTLDANKLKQTPIYDAYRKVAPKPEQFDQLCAKVGAMTDGFQDVPIDEVRALKVPTMFILGDADMVKPEHAVALFRAVGGGVFGDMVAPPPSRLAIRPGTTHFGLISRSKWIAEMVTEFLQPAAKNAVK